MTDFGQLPENFQQYQQQFPEMFAAYTKGAEAARASGPLDTKMTHLVQLGAAIGIRSEGAVRSHARRALEAGASHEELFQVINLSISTIGFPAAAAAYSWIRDMDRPKK
ncbi:MAG: carboxymuconolactone decarboxylase family protein [Proteobacteria bacterium]|nr:carboxymuconolactone decarboxylase family protein [Pseudomonadota bacterium]MBU1231878.1 carboxymuconolactone decarboxylase family protein [Pseudomonadota bacterium]MBU1418502.1 carboxymuconolactone decarboxylase family protein [Pseudomonadota bacterium]MBU1454873.1 carboxymuconolactone decarboxylase family protein [Pseudomonadota bacterium]